jgi:hypothetical protein
LDETPHALKLAPWLPIHSDREFAKLEYASRWVRSPVLSISSFLREAGWLTTFGIGAGLICSLIVTTLMRKLLFGVEL